MVAATRARITTTLRARASRSRRAVFWTLPIAAVLAASTALATNSTEVRKIWHRFVGGATRRAGGARFAGCRDELSRRALACRADGRATFISRSAGGARGASGTARGARLERPARGARKERSPGAGPRFEDCADIQTAEPPAEPTINTPFAEPTAGERGNSPRALQKGPIASTSSSRSSPKRSPRGTTTCNPRRTAALPSRRGTTARSPCCVSVAATKPRAALAPFARGEVGAGYRADEARSLLGALEARDH